MIEDVALRGRLLWKALPWGLYTTCSDCGEVTYCHGRARERMVCIDCFAASGNRVKLRRSGQTGKRRQYAYRTRRPKAEQIERARDLRDQGWTISAIHFELGISKRTVSNYLATSLPASQSLYPCGLDVTRKEEGGV